MERALLKQVFRIRQLREMYHLTQKKLGEILELDRSTIAKWEMGVTTPTTKNIIKLARIFDCSVAALFTDKKL